jgi:hypothetical protein
MDRPNVAQYGYDFGHPSADQGVIFGPKRYFSARARRMTITRYP